MNDMEQKLVEMNIYELMMMQYTKDNTGMYSLKKILFNPFKEWNLFLSKDFCIKVIKASF